MAARSWATSIFTAIGVAAGAGAAQLGLGYGLGIIAWQPTGDSATVWISSLGWVAWLAASSTVIGALCADRLAGAAPVPANPDSAAGQALTIAWRIVIALASAVGSLIIVPLVAIPARAPRPDNAAPYFAAGGYAVAGIILGLLVAICALTARAIAANVIATSAWVWTLAVVAVADVVRVDGETATAAQLGTWQFADGTWIRGTVSLPGALLMLAAALVIGGLAAWPAGRRGDNRVGVAIAGAAGPFLVAAAYFLAAPALGGERDQHLSAFYIAPYAVIAGLAGSVIVSAIGPRGSRAQARAARKAAVANRDARSASEISDWTAALAEADAAEARRRQDAGEEPGDDPWASPKDDKGKKKEPVTVGAAELDSTADLESDAYAPSRAYGKSTEKTGRTYTSDSANRAYAEDTVTEDESPTVPAATTSSSGHKPPTPLWPEQTTESAPAKPSTGRPKRGRGRQSE
ncbi:hypothetical protein ACFFX1_34780 [Dactylosporangium sucinum]|uniref:Uncharacterized protein n=1 Tax=Dactylosporangium sucinum TaxID=1424081 RepID=A0A917U154_9ACTN|nr:hypothetical protein [Dactylosporangium sucinum]GGM50732.1 hypothetical protein GCM10007977_060600 [Dactylosporangium sucinum]